MSTSRLYRIKAWIRYQIWSVFRRVYRIDIEAIIASRGGRWE